MLSPFIFMSNEALILLAVNAILGLTMYFMKQTAEATKQRLDKLESNVDVLKDTTFKKEEFREFKEELWVRMDKMEVAFDKRLQRLDKGGQ